jgi:energy-coupling factor transport system permease protein
VIALAPTYRPTGSALHRTRTSIAIAYLALPAVVAVCFDHPLVLAVTLGGTVGAGIAAGVGRELARAALLAAPLALLVLLINPIVSQQGLTVLVTGPVLPVIGPLDITLEAIAYGALAALRVLVLLLGFALFSAAVDPDELLRLFRRLSFRSALSASLATRLVPVLGRDSLRLADAYRLRAAAPVADTQRLPRVRRGATLTRALAAGALERAVDLAAALEVRGYGLARPAAHGASADARRWSRADRAFALAAVLGWTLALGGALAGLADFDAYPSLDAAAGPEALALCAALAATMIAPFALARPRRAS